MFRCMLFEKRWTRKFSLYNFINLQCKNDWFFATSTQIKLTKGKVSAGKEVEKGLQYIAQEKITDSYKDIMTECVDKGELKELNAKWKFLSRGIDENCIYFSQ